MDCIGSFILGLSVGGVVMAVCIVLHESRKDFFEIDGGFIKKHGPTGPRPPAPKADPPPAKFVDLVVHMEGLKKK